MLRAVVLSTRLTTSPCAVVADSYAWSGNDERLMAAQSAQNGDTGNFMTDFMKKAKRILEINPHHPLIEGILDKVVDDQDDEDVRATVKILWDTALVRSGFMLKDTHSCVSLFPFFAMIVCERDRAHSYFDRVEAMLRKSLGVSKSAQARIDDLKPAPPIETGPTNPDSGTGGTTGTMPDDTQWEDWSSLKDKIGKRDEL
jgi:heat shock protein beta